MVNIYGIYFNTQGYFFVSKDTQFSETYAETMIYVSNSMKTRFRNKKTVGYITTV